MYIDTYINKNPLHVIGVVVDLKFISVLTTNWTVDWSNHVKFTAYIVAGHLSQAFFLEHTSSSIFAYSSVLRLA